MFPLPQGPVISKPGSLDISFPTTPGINHRMLDFNIPGEHSFCVDMIGTSAYILDHHGPIVFDSPNILRDPHFEHGFTYWDDVSSGVNATITFHPETNSVNLSNDGGSHQAAIEDKILDNPTTDDLHLVFSVAGDGDLRVRVFNSIDGYIHDANYTSGSYDVAVTAVGPGARDDLEIWFVNEGAVGTSVDVISPIFKNTGVIGSMGMPYSADDVADVHFVLIEATNTMILTHRDYPPQEIIATDNGHGSWTCSAIAFTSSPAAWTGSNYPSTCEIYKGRLWFGTDRDIWASQSGNYYNFSLGTALDNESIQFEMEISGTIQWIKGQKELLVGGSYGEHKITSSGGVITPTDFENTQISAFGSTNIQALNMGDQVLYVSNDGRKIRAASFDELQEGWYSIDVTWQADHLLKEHNIVELHYVQEPVAAILCLLSDGSLISCTYERAVDVIGWATHIPDLGVNHLDYTSYVTICANKNPDGADVFFRIDSGYTYQGDNALYTGQTYDRAYHCVIHYGEVQRHYMDLTQVLPILESYDPPRVYPQESTVGQNDSVFGLTMGVKVDGAFLGEFIVDGPGGGPTGYIELPVGISGIAHVGMLYHQSLELLPIDAGSPSDSGSSMMKHTNKIYIRIYDSALPFINGTRPPDRSPSTPMGEVEPLISDDIRVSDVGRSRKGPITINQTLPFPLEVQAVFGEVTQKGL